MTSSTRAAPAPALVLRGGLAALAVLTAACAIEPLPIPMSGGAGAAGGGGAGDTCVPATALPCYTGSAGTRSVGVCRDGLETCDADGAGYGPCVGEILPSPEDCSTPFDEDCNGSVNEPAAGCDCVPGAVAACYSGLPATLDVGVCHGGAQVCNMDGTGYGPCLGEATASPETCSTPVDDDCDGLVNEEGEGCACVPGSTIACYSGPQGTEGVGTCHGGTQTCDSLGTGHGPCTGEVIPVADDCATLADESCDGLLNEGCGVVCAARMGGAGQDAAYAVAPAADGSSFVAGSFTQAATFGAGEPGETTLSPTGASDGFLARYNPDCSVAWVTQFGAAPDAVGYSTAALADGGVLVSGRVSGTTVFGAGQPGATTIGASGPSMFVAKYAGDGAFQWVKSAAGSGLLGGVSGGTLIMRPDGGFFVMGQFSNTATFGAGEPNETVLTGPLPSDTFVPVHLYVARYEADGKLLWAKGASGPGQVCNVAFRCGAGLASDGGLFVTGSFLDSVTFGAGEPLATMLEADFGYHYQIWGRTQDIFVARYLADGSLAWAKRAGGQGYNEGGRAVVAAPDGGAFVTGVFGTGEDVIEYPNWYPWPQATFGPGEAGETLLTSTANPGQANTFVARYHADGTLAWVRQTALSGGFGEDRPHSITTLPSGDLLLVGTTFADVTTFDAGAPNQISMDGLGSYVAAFTGDGAIVYAERMSDAGLLLEQGTPAAADGTIALAGLLFPAVTWSPGAPTAITLTTAGLYDGFLARYAP